MKLSENLKKLPWQISIGASIKAARAPVEGERGRRKGGTERGGEGGGVVL